MSKFICRNWCFLILITLIGTQTGLAKEKTKPTARNRIRLALMRAVPEKWKLESNYQLFEKAVSQAAQKKADVLITPECWLDGYASTAKDSTPEKIRTVAQPLDQSKYLKT